MEVSIEMIFHATEDTKKIFDPVFDLFEIKKEEFSEEKIVGHYGNLILFFKTMLEKRRADEFVQRLVSKISQVQLDEVLDNLEMYFEDSSLFLRIGKGEIVNKIISLQQNNAIKIKIKVPIYKKDEIAKTYVNLLKS